MVPFNRDLEKINSRMETCIESCRVMGDCSIWDTELLVSASTDKCDIFFTKVTDVLGRAKWPRGLRRRSAAARLLGLWFRIPSGAWMSVCLFVVSVMCCQRSLRELTTRLEESYRLWCVAVCDLETS